MPGEPCQLEVPRPAGGLYALSVAAKISGHLTPRRVATA
jgi:hypothetical protein